MPDFTRSLAVVIGIDRYQNGIRVLQTAGNDARAVAALLRDQHGYTPRLILDEEATLARLTALLRVELPAHVGPDDRVFFYFAGHGVALDGDDGPRGFVLPQDARGDAPESFLSMPDLHDALCSLRCRHLLAILDCCFAGAFRWSSMRDIMSPPSVLHQERYDRFIRDPAWQVISSGADDERVLDVVLGRAIGSRGEAGEHSPFAEVLLQGLSGAGDVVPAGGGDGVITASELFVYLDHTLAGELAGHHHRQTPFLWSLKKHHKGQYIFLAPGHELNLPPAPELSADNNPYRGLESYGEEHKDLFFGRDRVVASLQAHAMGRRLTVVVGASGTGKSSLVKAGLMPRLRANGWEVLPVVRPGSAPLRSLEVALLALGKRQQGADEVCLLPKDPEAQAAQIAVWSERHPASRILLVIDQLEEVVTMCSDEAERNEFLLLVASAIANESMKLRVVLTLRSDFEPQFAAGALGASWQGARFVVRAMTQDELREAIERPAAERVVYFEPPALVDEMINEVVQTPGALSLLSFILSEMYVRYVERHGSNRALTRKDYADLGGVIGALRHRASEEFAKLDWAHQATMRRLMLRMISFEGGEVARRRVPESELVYPDATENERVRKVVDQLTAARLVVKGLEGEGDPYVEPAHDELVRSWSQLWDWVRAEQEKPDDPLFQRRLSHAVKEWERGGEQSAGLLWQDASRSALLENVLKSSDPWPNAVETRFARASVKRRERNHRLKVLGVAAIALALAMVFGQWWVATEQRDQAESRALATVAKNEPQLDLALLLSNEALRLSKTYEARDALLANLLRPTPLLRRRIDVGRVLSAVAFSPDGSTLAYGSPGGGMTLWDIKRQESTREWSAGSSVGSIAFSPDGSIIAAGGEDGSIRIWNVRASQHDPQTLLGLADTVRVMAFSHDGEMLAAWSDNGTLRLWNVSDGTSMGGPSSQYWQETKYDDSFVQLSQTKQMTTAGLAFSPDGTTLAYAASDLRFWDVRNRSPIGTPLSTGEAILAVAFNTRGDTLASIDGNAAIRRWDVKRLKPIGDPVPLASDAEVAAFSPDGATFSLGREDGTILVGEVERPQLGPPLVATVEHTKFVFGLTYGVWSLTFDRTGGVLASGSGQRVISLWDLKSRNPIARTLVDGTSETVVNLGVAFGPDGTTLAAGGDSLRLWDLSKGNRSSTLPQPFATIVSFSPDGNVLASISDEQDRPGLYLWDVRNRRLMDSISGSEYGSDFLIGAFNPDGSTLAFVTDSGIHLWDMQSHRTIGRLRDSLASSNLGVIAYSPDGAIIASGSYGEEGGNRGSVRLWDMKSRRSTLLADTLDVLGVAFSPDGGTLAAGSRDGTVRLWNTKSKEPAGELRAHDGPVLWVAYGPDGTTLASAGFSDTVIRLWDAKTLQPIGRPLSDQDGLSLFAFSPDGNTLASVGRKGTIKLWSIGGASWKQSACALAGRNLDARLWQRLLPGNAYQCTCPGLPAGKGGRC